jgi:hypothetical protein
MCHPASSPREAPGQRPVKPKEREWAMSEITRCPLQVGTFCRSLHIQQKGQEEKWKQGSGGTRSLTWWVRQAEVPTVGSLEPTPQVALVPQASSPRDHASSLPLLSHSTGLGAAHQGAKCEPGPEGGARTHLESQKPEGRPVPGPKPGAQGDPRTGAGRNPGGPQEEARPVPVCNQPSALAATLHWKRVSGRGG